MAGLGLMALVLPLDHIQYVRRDKACREYHDHWADLAVVNEAGIRYWCFKHFPYAYDFLL